ncbi:dTMP kinase [Chlorobaculum parvum NCIB 8327]|uniref:Thymidylate kinase n=1 Tax=Chlorobaculum parvum (strain DSM 263 / NCIMB 8327) TaxID=517417 RepID=KTHY_CHLP8|nr:dTMP kinase [Chlorobaculum parvum]B3QP81.1 RecName: Full=Thymidylate kinase; AltName: Full=dTMP kinase [Chlorobaculum parvum NCIB 8327]ACF11734.1 dTMP kinase [Chlorobaculum parvum NCIB 8327]
MLITFEGIDGAGKSTQVVKLKRHLQERGREVLTLREPGGTPVAEQIRELLLESHNDITSIAELLLFSASRAELMEKIIVPALEDGCDVILDRFFDSTTAYQGYGRGLNLDMLAEINRIASHGIRPDITFYLDLTPEDALLRKFSEKSLPLAFESEELDRMENSGLEFYQRVRAGYHAILEAEPQRIIMIDALLTPQEIHRKILSALQALEVPEDGKR